MRFFTAVSFTLAAMAAAVSAQSATETGSTPAPTEGGTMGANAFTYPIAGDTIVAGSDNTITWTNVVGSTVTLVLVDGDSGDLQPVATIAANIDNTGEYTWSAPEDLPASSTYSIRISYDSNPNNFNYSDRFVYDSEATATPTLSTASSTGTTTSAPTSSTESTESITSTESETSSITSSASTTETESTSTLRTSTSTRRSTTSEATPSETSDGAPPSAASSTLSSPLAVIMAVLAAALFIH